MKKLGISVIVLAMATVIGCSGGRSRMVDTGLPAGSASYALLERGAAKLSCTTSRSKTGLNVKCPENAFGFIPRGNLLTYCSSDESKCEAVLVRLVEAGEARE